MKRYARWLVYTDTLVIAGVVVAAQELRFGEITGTELGYTNIDYAAVSVLIAAAWSVMLALDHSRATRVLGHGLEEYRRVWTATLSVFAMGAVASALFQLDIARGYLALALPLGLLMLTCNRMLVRRYVAARCASGEFVNSVLAVGDVDSVRELANSLAHAQHEYRIVGACVPNDEACKEGFRVIDGGPGVIRMYEHHGNITDAVLKSGADTVALTSGQLNPDQIRNLSWDLEKIDVDLLVVPGIGGVASPRLMVRLVGGVPLILVDKPQYEGAKRLRKRAFDVVFATLALALAAPLMVVVGLAVKLTSPGPVFYRAERIGLDGKPFRMIKFRSMVVDANQQLAELADRSDGNGVLFKMRSDPRVTAVGRVIRRYSIDEIPQFINVLRREMSVVGPRPPLRTEVELYDNHASRRMLVRPGITGLWQVSGRSDLSWDESVRLDLLYVENWSMVGDLVIVASTLKAVIAGSGAY